MAHRRAIEVVSRALANLICERNPRAEFENLPVKSLPIQGLRDADALSGPGRNRATWFMPAIKDAHTPWWS